MPIPGGFQDSYSLLWVIALPVFALVSLLLKRPGWTSLQVALAISCIVAIMTGVFFLYIGTLTDLEWAVRLLSVFFEFLATGFLLHACTDNKTVRIVIFSTGLIYACIFIMLLLLAPEKEALNLIVAGSYLLLFTMAVAVMVTFFEQFTSYITGQPAFWMTAGIILHTGLLSMLIILNGSLLKGQMDQGTHHQWYMLLNALKFLLFTVGVWVSVNNKPVTQAK